MNLPAQRVYLVDDDPAVLKGLSRLLRSAGYEPAVFSSAGEFMERYRAEEPGCVVLDLAMPGMSGLELQQWLTKSHSPAPIIFLTGHGDVPSSVRAVKSGAVDFLMKPVNGADLLKALEEARRRERAAREAGAELESLRARLATLTARERQVLEQVVQGRLNKQIAAELGTVEKTIKVHRARVMQKMGVQSLAELVRLAERVGVT